MLIVVMMISVAMVTVAMVTVAMVASLTCSSNLPEIVSSRMICPSRKAEKRLAVNSRSEVKLKHTSKYD